MNTTIVANGDFEFSDSAFWSTDDEARALNNHFMNSLNMRRSLDVMKNVDDVSVLIREKIHCE